MENASKALIMAASILLGIMLISFGVFMFSMYGDYSAQAIKTMSDTQISEFNAQFLKYEGKVSSVYIDEDGRRYEVDEDITCNIHEVISIANLAQQNNISHEFYTVKQLEEFKKADKERYKAQDGSFYVQVILKTKNLGSNDNHLEMLSKSGQLNLISSFGPNTIREGSEVTTNVPQFKCIIGDDGISKTTRRVNKITFEQVK